MSQRDETRSAASKLGEGSGVGPMPSPGTSAANGERHVLLGDPEALVEVNEDGSVAVTIDGTAYLSVQRLGEIVAFVEAHGQCQVVERDA